MRNIVGQIASKEDFYIRKRELSRIIRSLEAKANIQIAAPRRVGKSSILHYLKDNPPINCICIYIEVESARNENDFFRKIYREIVRSLINKEQKLKEQISKKANQFLAHLKALKIVGVEVSFNEIEKLSFQEELLNFLLGMDLENTKLILMIDEFPEVILNILEDDKGDTKNARNFLQTNRELRNNSELLGKVQFIYTGSSSLNITVSNLDSSALINDLNSVSVEPLTKEESKEFIQKVLATYECIVGEEVIEYALDKIEYFIPFYLQLLIQEILNIADNPDVNIDRIVIDEAIQKVVAQRNDNFFEHYIKRLKRVFPIEQVKIVMLLLNNLSSSSVMSKGALFGFVSDQISDVDFQKMLRVLEYDGYIKRDGVNYRFSSPILNQWWYNHEC